MLLEPFDNNYFKALIILLPGFVTLQVYRYLVSASGMSDLEMVMTALSFSLINFTIAVIVYYFLRALSLRSTTKARSWKVSIPFILLLVIISVGNGWLNAKVEERGIPYKIARTARSSGERTWVTAFRNNTISSKSFVRVTLSNGVVYGGWPESASESEDNELFIRPAYLIKPNKIPKKIDGQGILVFGKDIVSVEFVSEHPSKWKAK